MPCILSRLSNTKLKVVESTNHLPFIGLGLLLLLGLPGCQGWDPLSQPASREDITPVEILEQPTPGSNEAVSVASQTIPTPTPANISRPAISSPTPVYFTPTPGVVPSSEAPPAFSMCSPLVDHSLADLQEIISFPFDPPPPGKDTGHHGVDFAYYRRGERLSIEGVPIQSVLAGRVAAVNSNLIPYGNMVMVETPYEQMPESLIEFLGVPDRQSLYLLYAHMQEPPLLALGEAVACGQTLGAVGNTPQHWSSAPHLHFEARYGPAGLDFSGMRFYDPYAQVEEMEKYTHWRTSGEFALLDPVALLEYGLSATADRSD